MENRCRYALAGERNYVGNGLGIFRKSSKRTAERSFAFAREVREARGCAGRGSARYTRLARFCAKIDRLQTGFAILTATRRARCPSRMENGQDGPTTGWRCCRRRAHTRTHTHTKNMHAPRVLLPRATASTMARHGPESLRAQAQTHTHTHTAQTDTHTHRHTHIFVPACAS